MDGVEFKELFKVTGILTDSQTHFTGGDAFLFE